MLSILFPKTQLFQRKWRILWGICWYLTQNRDQRPFSWSIWLKGGIVLANSHLAHLQRILNNDKNKTQLTNKLLLSLQANFRWIKSHKFRPKLKKMKNSRNRKGKCMSLCQTKWLLLVNQSLSSQCRKAFNKMLLGLNLLVNKMQWNLKL